MIIKDLKEITNFDMFLDNNIQFKDFENGTLKTYNLDFKETIFCLYHVITINLYQYQDIYLNKTNFYLMCDFKSNSYRLFKEN